MLNRRVIKKSNSSKGQALKKGKSYNTGQAVIEYMLVFGAVVVVLLAFVFNQKCGIFTCEEAPYKSTIDEVIRGQFISTKDMANTIFF